MLKVAIADKSSHTRLVLQDLLSKEEEIEVAGVASDGDTLLKLLKSQTVDVALVDLDLPKNSRLFLLKRIFSEAPVPAVLLLKRTHLTLELIKQATELGVYAIILKEGTGDYTELRSKGAEVVQKIKACLELENKDMLLLAQSLEQQRHAPVKVIRQSAIDTVIVIGASTGGTLAVESIVKKLSPDLEAVILIAVHLPAQFTKSFARRLQELTSLKVVEGKAGLMVKKGKIIVAPGGKNMVVQPVMGSNDSLSITFSEELPVSYDLPSIDMLMASVAKSGVRNVMGVILTGMGRDGTAGASFIKSRGGIVLAQDEESSAIFGMAKSAIDSGNINNILPLSQIPEFINRYVAEQQQASVTGSIDEIERTGV